MIDLSNITTLKESGQLEAKAAKGGLPKSIWESISAFANTTGGVILLGISESKDSTLTITGLTNASKMLDDFWNSANSPDKLYPCPLSSENAYIQREDDKNIIVIEVPRAERHLRPVYTNGNPLTGTFRRKHTGDYKCTQPEVAAMMRDNTDAPLDAEVANAASIDNLNAESIAAYRATYNAGHENHAWAKLENAEFLCRIGAAGPDTQGQVRPTKAGLLMFGEEWIISRTFYNYFIEYKQLDAVNARWRDRFTSQDGLWSGNLYDFFYKAYNKTIQALELPFSTDGLYRQTTTPAHEAIREALVNVLTNADFNSESPVKITLNTEQIELENPGCFRVDINSAREGGLSNPRNKTLMKMFSLINLSERAGSGIPNMIASWEKSGFQTPILEEQFDPEISRIILPLKASTGLQNKKMAKVSLAKEDENAANVTHETNAEVALRIAHENGQVSTQLLASELGVSSATARKTLKSLQAQGKLKWVGKSKTDPTQHFTL